ncbi:MAG TPA: glucose-6-phosphate isomerase family protein [Candidatus Paceibacterota bacterium]|nr:glucose-6-phosphate isomerase family protein [Candidatus Paceibacterota bacterium]HRY77008.1 glucose-6-phosphate isomerase family protein [Candidatus Paceibacterota bacterium]
MENFCSQGQREVKRASELKAVLSDKNFPDDFVVYEVCRAEKRKGDLRYDLTLIQRKLLGRELPKTFGHYHLHQEPELYEILSGSVNFLIQRYEVDPLIISEAYLIEAQKGDRVIIPFGFGMVSINSNINEEALIGNWINNSTVNSYDFFQECRGACYYILNRGEGVWQAERNDNYKEVAPLIVLRPKILSSELENLNFLIQPEKYRNFLTIDNLYKKL